MTILNTIEEKFTLLNQPKLSICSTKCMVSYVFYICIVFCCIYGVLLHAWYSTACMVLCHMHGVILYAWCSTSCMVSYHMHGVLLHAWCSIVCTVSINNEKTYGVNFLPCPPSYVHWILRHPSQNRTFWVTVIKDTWLSLRTHQKASSSNLFVVSSQNSYIPAY